MSNYGFGLDLSQVLSGPFDLGQGCFFAYYIKSFGGNKKGYQRAFMFATCLHAIHSGGGLFLSLLSAGLIGGFTHCAGMCGPFVLAQMPALEAPTPVMIRLKAAALIPYHAGRMTTYVLLATVLASFVNLAFLFSPAAKLISGLLLMLAGVLFLASVFPAMSRVFPWAARIGLPIPPRWIEKASRPFLTSTSVLNSYVLGVILGFMPCGLVMAALMASASAGHTVTAALAMAVFAAGTIPGLWVTALGGQVVFQKWPGLFRPAALSLRAFSALFLIGLAATLLF